MQKRQVAFVRAQKRLSPRKRSEARCHDAIALTILDTRDRTIFDRVEHVCRVHHLAEAVPAAPLQPMAALQIDGMDHAAMLQPRDDASAELDRAEDVIAQDMRSPRSAPPGDQGRRARHHDPPTGRADDLSRHAVWAGFAGALPKDVSQDGTGDDWHWARRGRHSSCMSPERMRPRSSRC
jgi:hypothetical protein